MKTLTLFLHMQSYIHDTCGNVKGVCTVALEVARPNIARRAVFAIEQYSNGPIPLSNNGQFLRSNNGQLLGSNNGLFLGPNNGLFLRSYSGPFLRPNVLWYI